MTRRKPRKTLTRFAPCDPVFDPSVVRGRFGRSFLAALADNVARNGEHTIEKLRKRRPQDYVRLVAALLPKEFRLKEVDLPDFTEAERDAMLDMLRQLIAEKEKEQEQRGEKGAAGQEPGAPAQDGSASALAIKRQG
jgi:hypothetical protein